ncbi:DUF6049 family protein [Xylanimonas sp. McL0601]|uniref:DUF6049 family protein n=1 Tax=Xylanimonas sp. McL0601 TaxID=3414739 RepID=UPI003CF69F54
MTRASDRPTAARGARPLAARVAAGVAAVVALVSVGAGLFAGTAVADDTAPAPTAQASPAAATSLTLQELSPAVTHPGDDLTVTVHVANPTTELLEDASVELWIGWRQIFARSDLAEWADGTGELPRGTPQKTLPVEPLAPGESRDMTFTVPVDGLGLTARGPRDLAVTLVNGDHDSIGSVRTFLLWDPNPASGAAAGGGEEPVRLSLIAPVTGPAVDPADPLATQALAGPTAPGGALARTLAAVGTAEEATGARGALALAVDPALVATALASTNAQVAAWAGSIAALGDRTDVSPLPAYDADLAALAHAGLSASALTAAVATPLPNGWTVPSTWGAPVAWPAGPPAPDLATLGAGRSAGLGTAVVPAGLAPLRGTSTGLATVATPQGDVTAIVADGRISQELTDATDLASGATPALSEAEAVQRLLAETSVVSAQGVGDEPHLVAVLPRGWSPDVDTLRVALEALTASGWVRVTPLTDLLATSGPDVDRTPLADSDPQDGELAPEGVHRLDAARTSVAELATVAAQPTDITALVAPALAAPTSVAWRAAPPARAGAVASAVDAASALRKDLTVSVSTEVTLISAAGSLPVTVRNKLPADATVTVVLRPDDPRLVVDARPTQVVAAGGEARVNVPVRALASGNVVVEVQLLTPAGTPAAEPVTLQLRVRAGWETVGTAVLAGMVALLFVVGIWRTVRRGRSPRRTADVGVPDPAIPSDAERQA